MQFDPQRLARTNAVLTTLPVAFRRVSTIKPPVGSLELPLPPFSAVRTPDILPLAHARFEVVHEVVVDRLAPIDTAIDWLAVGQVKPGVLALLRDAEAAAAHDPVMRPCHAYGVYRLPERA
jgi:hypothetical protein